MGHQSVDQKSGQKNAVGGTVEMGHQSVDKMYVFFNDLTRFFSFFCISQGCYRVVRRKKRHIKNEKVLSIIQLLDYVTVKNGTDRDESTHHIIKEDCSIWPPP